MVAVDGAGVAWFTELREGEMERLAGAARCEMAKTVNEGL